MSEWGGKTIQLKLNVYGINEFIPSVVVVRKYLRCQAFIYFITLCDSENVAMTAFAIKALKQYWSVATQRELGGGVYSCLQNIFFLKKRRKASYEKL